MHCKTCGAEMNEDQVICLRCGCALGSGTRYCAKCGGELMPGAVVCMNCGVPADFGVPAAKEASGRNADRVWPANKDKVVAILLAFFFGGLGIHNFYLGETKKGVFRLCLCWCGIGGIFALIDLIKLIAGSYTVDYDSIV